MDNFLAIIEKGGWPPKDVIVSPPADVSSSVVCFPISFHILVSWTFAKKFHYSLGSWLLTARGIRGIRSRHRYPRETLPPSGSWSPRDMRGHGGGGEDSQIGSLIAEHSTAFAHALVIDGWTQFGLWCGDHCDHVSPLPAEKCRRSSRKSSSQDVEVSPSTVPERLAQLSLFSPRIFLQIHYVFARLAGWSGDRGVNCSRRQGLR